jgi:hypothetical protein
MAFAKSIRAAASASSAALSGRCGEAFDDYTVAIAAHSDAMTKAGGAAYESGTAVENDSRTSWIAIQIAKGDVRQHCLVNTDGRGLQGARQVRKRR